MKLPVIFFTSSFLKSNKQIYFYEEGVEKIEEVMKYFKTLTSSQIMATVQLYDHIKLVNQTSNLLLAQRVISYVAFHGDE